MSAIASPITSLTTVYSTVYSGADQRKPQSSASLAFVRGIHRWPVNSPHKGPVTRKMFPFDDVIMTRDYCETVSNGNTSMTTVVSSLGTLKSVIVMTSWYGNITHITGYANPPVDSPRKGPVMRSVGVFFDARMNNLRNKEWNCRWLETPRDSRDVTVICIYIYIYVYIYIMSH